MLPIALSMNGVESYKVTETTQHNILDGNHDLVVGSTDPYYGPDENVLKIVKDAAHKGVSAIYFADQFPGDERDEGFCNDMKWYDARGNLSFMTNDDSLA